MAITQKIRVEAETGERTLEVVWIGAGRASGALVRAGCLTTVGIIIGFIVFFETVVLVIIFILICNFRKPTFIFVVLGDFISGDVIVNLKINYMVWAKGLLIHHLVRVV